MGSRRAAIDAGDGCSLSPRQCAVRRVLIRRGASEDDINLGTGQMNFFSGQIVPRRRQEITSRQSSAVECRDGLWSEPRLISPWSESLLRISHNYCFLLTLDDSPSIFVVPFSVCSRRPWPSSLPCAAVHLPDPSLPQAATSWSPLPLSRRQPADTDSRED